jgi:phosphoglycolate phosphatase
VFVGDTGIDMASGGAAGMVTVGVAWGFRDVDELRRAGARHVAHRPDDLLELCDATGDG